MAEEEAHPETSASTPNSTNAPASGTKAPKDRQCPFCGQAFTSSSLGRHLDLYIKPKNPKPPDGVHDVDEIRKIRGNITRRQPRTSNRASIGRDERTFRSQSADAPPYLSSSGNRSARQQSHIVEERPVISPPTAQDAPPEQHIRINQANWQATGVINNLPPRVPSRNNDSPVTGQAQRIQEMRADNGGNKIPRPEYETDSMTKLEEAAEVGRAAEMALREILGSLEAAQKRIEPKSLFDEFDFYSLSFPALCLAILPPPGTLFSPTPFASAESWTIGPPGLRQFEALNRFLNERIATKRRVEHIPDSVAFKHHSHLSGSWEHWQNLTEVDRSSTWTLEILRSFTRSQDQNHQLRLDLEHAQQHTRHLEAEYDRLSRCQLPREYLMHPPNTVPVAPNVMREVRPSQFKSAGLAEAGYDAEALLTKWRTSIRSNLRSKSAAQATSQFSTPNVYKETKPNQIHHDMILNGAVWNVNGPMSRKSALHTEHAANSQAHELANVSYETPPNPGVVVSADEDESTASRAERDAEGEPDESLTLPAIRDTTGNYDAVSTRLSANGGSLAALLNPNGKRPVGLDSPGGRGANKVYKAQTGEGNVS